MSRQALALAIFAAAVLLVVPADAVAQELGVKAGINLASLTPEEGVDPDITRRVGLVAGGWIRTPAAARFSFQLEGLFSTKGVRYDGRPFGLDGDVDIRIRYFELPLLVRADFGTARATTRAFVVGGTAPAFRLSARTKASFQGEESNRDAGDDFKPLDVGLVGGIGVAFGRAHVEARYTHGILHINEDDNGDEDRIKNRVFSLTAGFRLR
jgi:hypothetical protein